MHAAFIPSWNQATRSQGMSVIGRALQSLPNLLVTYLCAYKPVSHLGLRVLTAKDTFLLPRALLPQPLHPHSPVITLSWITPVTKPTF